MKGDEVTIHYVGEVVDGEMQMVPVYHKRRGGEEAAKHILEAYEVNMYWWPPIAWLGAGIVMFAALQFDDVYMKLFTSLVGVVLVAIGSFRFGVAQKG